MRIGMLTSGGDCPGLNGAIRGFCKYAFSSMENVEILGFLDGYTGLQRSEYVTLTPESVEGILDKGGTILGSIRQPFKLMTVAENGERTKLDTMVETYKNLKLDALKTRGGAGTHKTASLRAVEGCNVIALPKTIDNDVYGTDCTFGFDSAVQTASDLIKRIRSTADSHGRVFFVEVMGNKAGWLTLHSAIAAGADGAIIPEIPYDENAVAEYILTRQNESRSTVIAIAEGAMSLSEAAMAKKDRKGLATVGAAERLKKSVEERTGITCYTTVLGHVQRGGEPSAYDKVLTTEMGAFAASLCQRGIFGVTVCLRGEKLGYNNLTEIAGNSKYVQPDGQLVSLCKSMGMFLGGAT